jgi:hypothetical protein
MDRLPLRLLAFALGPLLTRRAAEAARRKAAVDGAPQATRQLRTPGGAALSEGATQRASGAHAAGSDAADAVPAWQLASALAAALAITGVLVASDGGAERRKRSARRATEHASAPSADRADLSRDFGGV